MHILSVRQQLESKIDELSSLLTAASSRRVEATSKLGRIINSKFIWWNADLKLRNAQEEKEYCDETFNAILAYREILIHRLDEIEIKK